MQLSGASDAIFWANFETVHNLQRCCNRFFPNLWRISRTMTIEVSSYCAQNCLVQPFFFVRILKVIITRVAFKFPSTFQISLLHPLSIASWRWINAIDSYMLRVPNHDALFVVCFVRSRYLVVVLSAHATYERNRRKLRTDFSLFTLRADVCMYICIYLHINAKTYARTHTCVCTYEWQWREWRRWRQRTLPSACRLITEDSSRW